MKNQKKLLAVLLVLVMALGMLAGCQKAPEPKVETPVLKDTIKMAVYSDFKSFDPYNSGMTLDRVVYNNIFDTLLRFYDGKFENVLITGYTVSTDGTVYTFKLKDNVKFHNGEKFTASDVVFSLERAKTSNQMANFTKSITKVEAVDALTVKVTLEKPYVPFLNAVAATVCMMNEKAVKAAGDKISLQPVGTGPYTFVKWDAGSQVVLERFADYHGDKPQIKTATYVVLTNPETALIATQTKEVDLTYTIPPVAAPQIKTEGKLTLDLNPTMGSGYIVMNLEAPFISDVNFRKALAYATNREEIVAFGMDGIAEVSTKLYDEQTVGYTGEFKIPEFNIEKAKEFLAKTSYKGETISFKVGYENYKKIGIVYQEQLKKVGINISVELLEANTWVADMKSGNYSMSTIVMTIDPDVALWSTTLHSSAIGGYNFSRLNDKAVDAAFDNGASILDPVQRKAAYAPIEQKLYEDVVLIPIYRRVVTACYNPDLTIERAFNNGFSSVEDMAWKK
jgi:ABC-type transport system substrate-binding protein